MINMDKYIYLTKLYDYYKELFTLKQQSYFEEYYFENLSLQEISENYHVSRNAVHNQIKIVEKKLLEYEEKLGINLKKDKILELLNGKISDKIIEKIEEII